MTKQTRHQPREKVCNNSYLTLTTMARLQGVSGGLSGRTGSFTYRQSRGQTIVSQYQPIVKNPNTAGQQDQRARFKLMSQLAAVMAPGFGTMGITKRPGKQRPTQRNAFMNLNMPLVEVETSADTTAAKIPMEQLKLTSSFRKLGTIALTDESLGEMALQIDGLSPEVKTARIVVVGYKTVGGMKQANIVSMVDVPAVQNSISHNFKNLPYGDYTVLAYGLIPNESGKAKIDIDNIHTPNDDNFVSAIELNKLVADGTVIETETIGANVTLNAA